MEPLEPIYQNYLPVSNVSQASPIDLIPKEILLIVFSYLKDNPSIRAATLTCKRFYSIISSDPSFKIACARRYYQHAKATCRITTPESLMDKEAIEAKKFFNQTEEVYSKELTNEKVDGFIQKIKTSKQSYAQNKRNRVYRRILWGASFTAMVCGGQFGLIISMSLLYSLKVHGDFQKPK